MFTRGYVTQAVFKETHEKANVMCRWYFKIQYNKIEFSRTGHYYMLFVCVGIYFSEENIFFSCWKEDLGIGRLVEHRMQSDTKNKIEILLITIFDWNMNFDKTYPYYIKDSVCFFFTFLVFFHFLIVFLKILF